MPKRTNEFQQLIFLIKQQLAEDATVTESEFLADQRTGEKVEVDVCIRTRIAGHEIIVGIECEKHGRKSGREWVNEMIGKHATLPTHVLALASGKGFTRGAIKRAAADGIELINLENVEDGSWKGILANTDSLWIKAFGVRPTRVHVFVETKNEPPLERVLSIRETSLFLSDGSEVSCVGNLVDAALRSEMFAAEFLPRADPEHKFFEFGFPVPAMEGGKRTCLQCLNPSELRPVQSIRIVGECTVEKSEFPIKRGLMGKVAVTWGTGTFLGKDALLVATTDEDGVSRMSVKASGIPTGPFAIQGEPENENLQ